MNVLSHLSRALPALRHGRVNVPATRHIQFAVPTLPAVIVRVQSSHRGPHAVSNNRRLTSMAASKSGPPRYEYIEDVEHLEYYTPGGYHTISINDRLHNRYRIVHKLGHGSYSTVWLALDEMASSMYVAIKVCTASAEDTEINVLSELGTAGTKDERSSLIPVILDRFTLDGPNGTHSCLVTAPARCSLREAREASNRLLFQLDVARSMAAQLTMAVAYVHSRGYAHGDIHFGNIFLQLPSSLNRLIQELYNKFDAPDPQPVTLLRPKDSTDGDPGSLPAGVPPMSSPPSGSANQVTKSLLTRQTSP